MPTILVETTILANTTNANLVSGSSFEFARGSGLMSAGVAGSATGLVTNIQAGADVVAEAFACPILTRYPILPDEMYFAAALNGGDRIVFRTQNTTGGNLTARAVIQLSYNG